MSHQRQMRIQIGTRVVTAENAAHNRPRLHQIKIVFTYQHHGCMTHSVSVPPVHRCFHIESRNVLQDSRGIDLAQIKKRIVAAASETNRYQGISRSRRWLHEEDLLHQAEDHGVHTGRKPHRQDCGRSRGRAPPEAPPGIAQVPRKIVHDSEREQLVALLMKSRRVSEPSTCFDLRFAGRHSLLHQVTGELFQMRLEFLADVVLSKERTHTDPQS
jgi:hypothetical protein